MYDKCSLSNILQLGLMKEGQLAYASVSSLAAASLARARHHLQSNSDCPSAPSKSCTTSQSKVHVPHPKVSSLYAGWSCGHECSFVSSDCCRATAWPFGS